MEKSKEITVIHLFVLGYPIESERSIGRREKAHSIC